MLDSESVATAVAGGFAAYSAGRAEAPLRLAVSAPAGPAGPGGTVLTMPCAVSGTAGSGPASRLEGPAGATPGDPAAVGTKIVSVFPANRERGLPTVQSLYVLLDGESGAPLAVMDGAYLTGVRTAAGSAVATRALARPDATTLGLFGTGVQARFHAEALLPLRPFRRVLVAGTSPARARAFAAWMEGRLNVAAEPASPAAVSGADVVAACTTSATPVVVDEAVRPGAHLNAVGAFSPRTRELPGALVARARVFVDTRAGALAEAGDLLIPQAAGELGPDPVAGELGELLLGRVEGRRDADEVTVYKSVGAAFLDAVTARLAFDRAAAAGVGTPFSFAG